MKILGICGSPRHASTEYALEIALEAAGALPGIETEQVNLCGKTLQFCLGCYACKDTDPPRCTVYEDDINPLYEKMLQADAFLLASPVYNMGMSPLLQTVFQRMKPLGRHTKSGQFALKPAAGIAVGGSRNGGQETTLSAINNMVLSLGMLNLSCGVFAYNGAAVWSNDRRAAGVKEDAVGCEELRMLGRRVAVVTAVLQAGLEASGHCNQAQLLGFADDKAYQKRLSRFYTRDKEED